MAEHQRRRTALAGRVQGVTGQEHRLHAEAARHAEMAGMAASAEAFFRRIEAGLATASFEQSAPWSSY